MKSSCIAFLTVAALTASVGLAQQPAKETKPAAPAKAAQPAKPGDHAAPPAGMSEADMKACMDAATPGPMHAHLIKNVGTWTGQLTSYCGTPEPVKSECTTTIAGMMEGRFTKCETLGDMPGMGPFTGFGIYGYDNVSKKFQMTWLDNMGTGMMTGTGDLSSDGKTLNWACTYNCPVAKGPIACRIVETFSGKDTMTMTMYGPNPMEKGKEMKMMEIAYTRKAGTASATPSKTAK